MRIARAGEPWRYLPFGVAAVEQVPGDVEVRLLTAMNFAMLGLRTPAKELLSAIPGGAGVPTGRAAHDAQTSLARVQRAIDECPDDALQPGRLVRAVRAACETLAARGVDLRGHIPAWRARIEAQQWLLANDGNVVRRAPGQGAKGWIRLADDRAAARRTPLPHLGEDGAPMADQALSPILFDGLDSPWLLLRVWETTPATGYGHQPRLTLVVRDVFELFDSVATADLRPVLADERVELFIGDGADSRLRAALESRSHLVLAGQVIGARRGRADEERRVIDLVQELTDAQTRESQALTERVDAVYAGRDAPWWRERFRQARAGGAPLRVLIPTTTNSTFVRHSADDLAAALTAAGHGARVLREPDTWSKLALPAYLRIFESWRPDLVVLFNHTRAQREGAIPANVPAVCWIQDRTRPLFDESVGAAQGPLDFVTGHMFADLFTKHRWPRERAWSAPVCASAHKFHDAPVAAPLRERFGCELAYVSHQGEPPEAMLDRCVRAARGNPLLARFLRELFPRLVECVEAPGEEGHHGRYMRAVKSVRVKGSPYVAVKPEPVWNEFGIPLVERIVRFQTIRWAAGVCRRRGWRFRLFGKGWERSAALAPYGAGALEHGEEIRACYQVARAHLHASSHTSSHQRVFECALSGGLMLRRLAVGDLGVIEQMIAREHALATGCPVDEDVTAPAGATDLGRRYTAMRTALGLPEKASITIKARLMRHVMAHPPVDTDRIVELALPAAAETCFTSEQELERRLERAVEDSRWRRDTSRAHAAFVGEKLSYDAFVAGMLERIESGLAEACAGRR